MNCIVIGGSGFLGTALVEQLLARNKSVTVIDLHETPTPVTGVRYVVGNYGDAAWLRTIVKPGDAIIHLAYASTPKTSFDDPLADMLENLPASLTLFQVAVSVPVSQLVIVSSGGTVYGVADDLPIPETAPTNPISPYGITKLAIEKYALMYHGAQQLPVVIARPANAYGEKQRPYTGQGFIATAVASMQEHKPITIFGAGDTIRDYIHVDDIATGLIALLEHGQPGEIYNLGNGKGITNKEIITALEPMAQQAELVPTIHYEEKRGFDVPANILDTTKVREQTGWSPSVAWEDGLKRVWQYRLQQRKGTHE
jgi:UDP-glucose 4-epimerase